MCLITLWLQLCLSSWALWCDNGFFLMLVICLHVENGILFCKIYSSPICSTFCFKILDFGVVGFSPTLFHL